MKTFKITKFEGVVDEQSKFMLIVISSKQETPSTNAVEIQFLAITVRVNLSLRSYVSYSQLLSYRSYLFASSLERVFQFTSSLQYNIV